MISLAKTIEVRKETMDYILELEKFNLKTGNTDPCGLTKLQEYG